MPPQVAVPVGIGISTSYQRYPGDRRLNLERKVVSLLQD